MTDQNRDYGPEKDRTCPLCKKVFSIVTGLAYHIGEFSKLESYSVCS